VRQNIDLRMSVGKSKSIVFTALNRMGQRNYTYWLTGAAVTVNGWNTGEPADFTMQNCGAIQLNANLFSSLRNVQFTCSLSRNGKWLDTRCIDSIPYICETPAPTEICKS
jgi:hypothetical protein